MQDKLSLTYNDAVQTIKNAILDSQLRATQHINEEQLALYYGIGQFISKNTRTGAWGTKAIETISRQLSVELPGLKGYSATNLKFMRLFYEAWSDLFNSSATAGKLEEHISSAAADASLSSDNKNMNFDEYTIIHYNFGYDKKRYNIIKQCPIYSMG